MTVVNPPAPPWNDVQPNPPFLGLYTEEDMGLKTLLQGVTVTDLNTTDNTQRPVPVWFHNPEREERRITYPNITINFTGERVAHEREHRGWVQISYRYLQNIPFDDPPPSVNYPLPMDFDYTITASARINQHISQISGTLAQGRLHPRFAVVTCPGGTIRRLEVLAVTRANSMEADKRLFRQVYQVRIPTEIEDIVGLVNSRVSRVVLTLSEIIEGQPVDQQEITVSAIADTESELPPSIPGQYGTQSGA